MHLKLKTNKEFPAENFDETAFFEALVEALGYGRSPKPYQEKREKYKRPKPWARGEAPAQRPASPRERVGLKSKSRERSPTPASQGQVSKRSRYEDEWA